MVRATGVARSGACQLPGSLRRSVCLHGFRAGTPHLHPRTSSFSVTRLNGTPSVQARHAQQALRIVEHAPQAAHATTHAYATIRLPRLFGPPPGRPGAGAGRQERSPGTERGTEHPAKNAVGLAEPRRRAGSTCPLRPTPPGRQRGRHAFFWAVRFAVRFAVRGPVRGLPRC